MPSIYERLRSDIVTAMKARDSKTALILRTLDAAIQRSSMDLGKPIDDGLVITALRKSVKNLADARAEFEKGGRTDLVANNSAEIAVLENYLPKGLDPAQVDALIAEAIRSTGATSKKEMGKVIAALKVHPDAGSLDFGAVSKLIQARLV
ncbi:MAG TPA: GatB/YqeY domain-containing protein [Opitutaceae bacterium]|nr:GatB/YqeY domain-containing protein [Opitutaceae bacterium]